MSYYGNCLYICVKYQKEDDTVKSVDIKEVMDTWTLQMGYPVVTVTRTGSQISATQQRFLFSSQSNFTEEFTSPYGLVLLCIYNMVIPVRKNIMKNIPDVSTELLECFVEFL